MTQTANMTIIDKLRQWFERPGGSIAHHHGIGRVRREWLPEQLGESYQTLRSLKQALDPAGIMNPGALVDMEEGG